MKKSINTLEEALIQEMENLYCSEKKLASGLSKLATIIPSEKLHALLANYVDSANHKCLKIDRIFSYLNHEPRACSTNVVDEMINETRSRITFTQDCRFQDLLVIACLQRINNYMMCAFRSSLRYADELELDTPVELLETMIHWEVKMEEALSQIANNTFNAPLEPSRN